MQDSLPMKQLIPADFCMTVGPIFLGLWKRDVVSKGSELMGTYQYTGMKS